jgi:nicotinamide-nucleotide amidase
VNIEIINTGGELMLGRTLNTHSQWLARQLADRGLVVTRQTAVADTSEGIMQAVREALSRAELVITTGGLGPTSDDLTREALAQMLGRKLQPNAEVAAHIRNWFESRNLPVPASTRAETFVPEGAIVLPNAHGTAPGLVIEIGSGVWRLASGEQPAGGQSSPDPGSHSPSPKWLVMLPGPPRELKPMFTTSVVPLLAKMFHAGEPFACRTLRTIGLGEALLAERVGPKLVQIAGLEIGYCAHMGQVDVRLEARGAARGKLLQAGEAAVRAELGDNIFGMDDDTLESVILHLLAGRKQTLALAESCTGGFIAHKLTNVPGASAVLLAGVVTYSNAAKRKFLGVREETLAEHGAVSEAVAREMAKGARRETGADFALAVTGIAGPGGGTPEKPVGTVFIALASAARTDVLKKLNAYDRETFKELTARHALGMLFRAVRA